VEGRPILVYRGGRGKRTGGTLLVGGIHGDEYATILLLESFIERCAGVGPLAGSEVLAIPAANPDGVERRSRYNARGVDLNRNCEINWSAGSQEPSGPQPWSEPESRALRDLILLEQPSRIVCLHWALGEIDADGAQSRAAAFAMWDALSEAERTPYRIRVCEEAPPGDGDAEGCPGSFGQWCGYALRYPDGSAPAMITLELPYDPRRSRPEVLPADHLETLRKAWTADSTGYMAAVEEPVHRMLAAVVKRRGN